jgi:hypothetical protein
LSSSFLSFSLRGSCPKSIYRGELSDSFSYNFFKESLEKAVKKLKNAQCCIVFGAPKKRRITTQGIKERLSKFK